MLEKESRPVEISSKLLAYLKSGLRKPGEGWNCDRILYSANEDNPCIKSEHELYCIGNVPEFCHVYLSSNLEVVALGDGRTVQVDGMWAGTCLSKVHSHRRDLASPLLGFSWVSCVLVTILRGCLTYRFHHLVPLEDTAPTTTPE